MDKGVKEIWILALGIALVFLLAKADFAHADEPAKSGESESFSSKIERLENFRAENPEGFHRWVEQHRSGFRQRMMELKEKDPAKFQEIIARRCALKDRWAERTREKNPERYDRWMQYRRQHFENRLQEFRQNHPQEYEKVMSYRRARIDSWKARNPERYERFMQNHPNFRQRMERARAGENHPPYGRRRFRDREDHS